MANNTSRKTYIIKALCFFFLLIGTLSSCTTSSKQEQQQVEQKRQEQQQVEQKRNEQADIWKKFAGNTYAIKIVANNSVLYSVFDFNTSGRGKYYIEINGNAHELDIYKVTSDGACLYLHVDGLDTPVIVEIRGNELYNRGGEKYYIWD